MLALFTESGAPVVEMYVILQEDLFHSFLIAWHDACFRSELKTVLQINRGFIAVV